LKPALDSNRSADQIPRAGDAFRCIHENEAMSEAAMGGNRQRQVRMAAFARHEERACVELSNFGIPGDSPVPVASTR
jgi:hypothetical protein